MPSPHCWENCWPIIFSWQPLRDVPGQKRAVTQGLTPFPEHHPGQHSAARPASVFHLRQLSPQHSGTPTSFLPLPLALLSLPFKGRGLKGTPRGAAGLQSSVSESASQKDGTARAHTCRSPRTASARAPGWRGQEGVVLAGTGSVSHRPASCLTHISPRRRTTAVVGASAARRGRTPDRTLPKPLESGRGFAVQLFHFLGPIKCYFPSFSCRLHAQIYKIWLKILDCTKHW